MTLLPNLLYVFKDVRLSKLHNIVNPRPEDKTQGVEKPWPGLELQWGAKNVGLVIISGFSYIEAFAHAPWQAEEVRTITLGCGLSQVWSVAASCPTRWGFASHPLSCKAVLVHAVVLPDEKNVKQDIYCHDANWNQKRFEETLHPLHPG